MVHFQGIILVENVPDNIWPRDCDVSIIYLSTYLAAIYYVYANTHMLITHARQGFSILY